jgi:hypothetical protein
MVMINRILSPLLIALLLLPIGCRRQSAPQTGTTKSSSETRYPNLKTQADELNQVTLKGDDARAADLTYPKLIEVMGGREQYIDNLKTVRDEMQSEKFSVLSATVGDPTDIVEVENQIYAIVPVTMRMKVPEGILVGRSSMIGVSNDGGKNWTFVTANRDQLKGETLKILFPAAADKLRIPEPTEPVLERQTPTP